MSQAQSMTKRLLLALLLTGILSGCAVYEPIPAGHYIVNADGSRTFVQASYSCPVGYTCTYPASSAAPTYGPVYYGYPQPYYGPSPYFWPPLFFGLGYYYGGHRHYHHSPRPHRSGSRR